MPDTLIGRRQGIQDSTYSALGGVEVKQRYEKPRPRKQAAHIDHAQHQVLVHEVAVHLGHRLFQHLVELCAQAARHQSAQRLQCQPEETRADDCERLDGGQKGEGPQNAEDGAEQRPNGLEAPVKEQVELVARVVGQNAEGAVVVVRLELLEGGRPSSVGRAPLWWLLG